MATAVEIDVPDFDFSTFYYPEIYRALRQYQRTFVPEITDEADEEPFQQLLRAYALTAHLNNVLLDITANEALLPTARLLESVRGHLALIDVTLKQATPAVTDEVIEFSKVFDVVTNVLPERSRFATAETSESPQILYENIDAVTISRTDRATAMYSFNAGLIKILDNAIEAGDGVTLAGVDFRAGIEYSVGGTLADTLANITSAINQSSQPSILNIFYALSDGTDTISIIKIDGTQSSISLVEIDTGTDNFEVQDGGFGSNKAGLAVTESSPFDMFTNVPKAGDAFYIGHADVMWDAIGLTFDVFGSGISGVWEFYDGNRQDANPDSVTNLGSNLEFDLTTMLGALDRSGSVVEVVLSESGASETVVSKFVGGKNIAQTKGLLGQVAVSIEEQDYIIGALWNEVQNLTDNSESFVQDGVVNYELPQTLSENWIKSTINGVESHWLRYRVVSVTAPVNPRPDLIDITADKQYLLVPIVQGQTVADAPLGSSNGGSNQNFTLTFRPLIEGSLIIEIDEGSGFEPWDQVKNLLNSTSSSKHYLLEVSGDDIATVKFGDGVQGKIPSVGVDNIRAIYRIGADVNGNVGANTIVVNKSGIPFVNRVFNPRQATGYNIKEGSTDADLARLKIEGPASIRTLGRAITPEDIEFLATQFTDANGSQIVERCFAFEEVFGVKTIQALVVGVGGVLLTEAQKEDLQNFFNGNDIEGIEGVLVANHEVVATNYTQRVIDVTAVVTGGTQAAIVNAIKALLNPSAKFSDGINFRWEPGDEVPRSIINAEIFEAGAGGVKKVVITEPAIDVQLGAKELPIAGNISVTIV